MVMTTAKMAKDILKRQVDESLAMLDAWRAGKMVIVLGPGHVSRGKHSKDPSPDVTGGELVPRKM